MSLAFANAQADLGHCYPHMPEDMFSHGAASLMKIVIKEGFTMQF